MSEFKLVEHYLNLCYRVNKHEVRYDFKIFDIRFIRP